MKTIIVYIATAFAEIAGCFSFWMVFREGKASWWLILGMMSLALFAWLLARVDSAAAGRAYAAYGGIYILASLAWLWRVEGVRPDRWDTVGALIALFGAAVIIWGPRAA